MMPWPVLLLVLLVHGVGAGNCGARQVLTSTHGLLGDGPLNYASRAACEFHIVGGSSLAGAPNAIVLTFGSFATECAYDFLFVYDGDTFGAPLLAAFTGNQLPPMVVARSGHMLVYLYGDVNYSLDGFSAEYFVSPCPLNCSDHGVCLSNGVCQCDPDRTGEACEIERCPNDCGSHGACVQGRCSCHADYAGPSCNVSDSSLFVWSPLMNGPARGDAELPARAKHAMTYLDADDVAIVFGGHGLSQTFNDVWMLLVSSLKWRLLAPTTTAQPVARYALGFAPLSSPFPAWLVSAATSSPTHIFIAFGGLNGTAWPLGDAWLMTLSATPSASSASSIEWHEAAAAPEPRAGHSCTEVPDGRVIVLGGSTTRAAYAFGSLEYTPTTNAWRSLSPIGTGPGGLYGHSALLVEHLSAILVFGGASPVTASFSLTTDALYLYHYGEHRWTSIVPAGDTFLPVTNVMPTARSFAAAAMLTPTRLIVAGGYEHRHWLDETCYGSDTFMFDLACGTWVRYSEPLARTILPVVPQGFTFANGTLSSVHYAAEWGRFGHTGFVRQRSSANGATRPAQFVVLAGFSGVARHDISFMNVPLNASHSCTQLPPTASNCYADTECSWCARNSSDVGVYTNGTCLAGETAAWLECDSEASTANTSVALLTRVCADPCSNTHSCIECAQSVACGWCGGSATCMAASDLPTECFSVRVTSTDACRLESRTNGTLSFERWDSIGGIGMYALQTAASFPLYPTLTGRLSAYDTGTLPQNTGARLRGFIVPPVSGTYTFAVAADDTADLYLSSSPFPTAVETATVIASVPGWTHANEYDKYSAQISPPLILQANRWYYTELRVKNGVGDGFATVVWTAPASSGISPDSIVGNSYIWPWTSGNCSNLPTCGACAADFDCGWCVTTHTCVARLSTAAETCGTSALAMDASECESCTHEYRSCDECASRPTCEWYASRGCQPRSSAVDVSPSTGIRLIYRNVSQCEVPCRLRPNCASCADTATASPCYWCESTNSCVDQASFTSLYPLGQCRSWVSTGRASQCPNCTRHDSCASCIDNEQCGWCFDASSPARPGHCVFGALLGSTLCPATTTHTTASNSTAMVTTTIVRSWAYTSCPDIDECAAGLALCHANATCTNLPGSFLCECLPGYTGTGVHCVPVCSQGCASGGGVCAAPDECVCHDGFHSANCSQACICNGHASCDPVSGVCHACRDNTEGGSCERCRAGYFGDARAGGTCSPCECGVYGDELLGLCSPVTGDCFCRAPATGVLGCDACQTGYYAVRNATSTQLLRCVAACDERVQLVQQSGYLGTGKGQYDPMRTCQWVIQPAGRANVTATASQSTVIRLTFRRFATECSYDYLFLFDGDSVRAPRLGSFSGTGLPAPVVAYSGALLVRFYSDTNFVLDGFEAFYEVVPLASVACPQDCGKYDGRGACSDDGQRCECASGWSGADCGTVFNGSTGGTVAAARNVSQVGAWQALTVGLLARASHTATYLAGDDSLVILGGYLQRSQKVLWHAQRYSFARDEWQWILHGAHEPSARYSHATVALAPTRLLVFGGETSNLTTSDEMWTYEGGSGTWSDHTSTLPPLGSPNRPHAVSGHSLTYVPASSSVYLIGGTSDIYGYTASMFHLDTDRLEWTRVPEPVSGGLHPGVFGHAAAVDLVSERIYVSGGLRSSGTSSFNTDALFIYAYRTNEWRRVAPRSGDNLPPHYLATSVWHDGRLVLAAGSTFSHGLQYPCYASDVLVYTPECNSYQTLARPANATGPTLAGSIGSAGALRGDQLIVSGGFAGVSQATSLALQLPRGDEWCSTHDVATCATNPSCTLAREHVNGTLTRQWCLSVTASRALPSSPLLTFLSYENQTACDPTPCNQLFSCDTCTAATGVSCGWCVGALACMERDGAVASASSVGCPASTTFVTTPQECFDSGSCRTSVDCRDCNDRSGCIASNQFLCSSTQETPAPVAVTCNPTCDSHATCGECTSGSNDECAWCDATSKCIRFDGYLGLQVYGQCLAWTRTASQCPKPCATHTDCESCGEQAECGWCAEPGVLGRGVCMDGAASGPATAAQCTTPNNWAYTTCPDVDECLLGTATCAMNATCANLVGSYECTCDAGFSGDGLSVCEPVCSQGCSNGFCLQPDVCQCFLGYRGYNCSDDCGCNGHSHCVRANECLQCLDHTTGAQCDECEQGYFGTAIGGGLCQSCEQLCHGNSANCTGGASGGTCVNCANQSRGDFCDECVAGYTLYRAAHIKTVPGECHACPCNGHSTTCDGRTGVCSQCRDGTQGVHCEQCQELLVGSALNGGRCFRTSTQDVAPSVGQELLNGEQMSVVLSPQFHDTPVRVTVDVRAGGRVDLVTAMDAQLSQVVSRLYNVERRVDTMIPTSVFEGGGLVFVDVTALSQATTVRVYFTQSSSEINLVLFFTVFFASFFFLLLVVVAMGRAQMRRVNIARATAREQAILRLAERPIGQVWLLLGSAFDHAQWVHRLGSMAHQPLAKDLQVAAHTYFVEHPHERASARPISLGTALLRTPPPGYGVKSPMIERRDIAVEEVARSRRRLSATEAVAALGTSGEGDERHHGERDDLDAIDTGGPSSLVDSSGDDADQMELSLITGGDYYESSV